MFEIKVIEKEFKCSNKNHKDPVEMVIWDDSAQKEERLICKQCQLQQSRAKSLMPFANAYELAIEKQKKIIEQISPTIQANQKFLNQLEQEMQTLKTIACKTLDGLIKNTKDWQENLHKIGQESANFSLIQVFDTMVAQKLTSDEQVIIMNKIYDINNAYFHKIDNQLENFLLFKEYPKCQQSLINVIVNLNNFTQAEIQSSEDNHLNNAYIKSKSVCKEHKKEIIFVNLSENIKKELRSACRQCNRRDGEFLEDFIVQWKNYSQKQKEITQRNLDQLTSDIDKKNIQLNKLRSDFLSKLSKGIKQLWDIQLKGLKKQFQTSSYLQKLVNEGLVNDMAEKLSNQEEKTDDLQEEIIESISKLKKDIQNSFIEFEDAKQQKQNEEKIILQQTFDQNSLSIGMAFNKDGSKIITSSDSDLILWNFNQKEIKLIISKVTTLKGHNDYINCVLFNKSSNGIISGCEDSTIRVWKQINEKQWDFVEAQQKHNKKITCLILNSQENQLFSGSSDSKICVWDVDFSQLKISYKQTLQNHTQDVYSISLNQSNTYLVSCSFDQTIVIWELKQNEWQFKETVQNQVKDFGYKVSFLSDTMFIWVSANELQGSVCVFQLVDQKFVEQNQKKISLSHSSDTTDCMYFPIVFNATNGVAYIKHKKHLYFIKVEQETLNLSKNAIELQENTVGAISNDGQNLIVYNLDQKQLQILQIK